MKKKNTKIMCENSLLILTICSVFIGITLGFLIRQTNPSIKTINFIGFPGEILMNMLKLTILPLISSSLISGLSQLNIRTSGKIGACAFLYYLTTMVLAVATGIIVVIIIQPGDPSIKQNSLLNNKPLVNVSAAEKITDLLRNMFPDNIVQATFQQLETEYKEIENFDPFLNKTIKIIKLERNYVNGMNVLGLIVFFISIGLIMGYLHEKAKPLIDLFVSLDIVITTLVSIIMWYSPIGIASLIASKILEIGDLTKTVRVLGLYMITVILGLVIHLFITLPLLLFFVSKKNPYIFMKGLMQAAITAFGTASSAASLPVTFKCLEEINFVDSKYTKFVLPVGAVVNMDGTALYEAVASVFIAQINGLELGLGTLLTISVTATLASIGAASIPSAGLVTMLLVLTAVGLPASDVTLIIAVDWFLDRLRTLVNVMGDGIGCGFVQEMIEKNINFSNLFKINKTAKIASFNNSETVIENKPDLQKNYHEMKVNPSNNELHIAVNGGADFIHNRYK